MIAEVVLFVCLFIVYIHVMDEYKKGEDLEMLEMDYFGINGTQLNDACRLKQPLIFEFGKVEPELFRKLSTGAISRTTNESMNVLDTSMPAAGGGGFFPLPFESAIQLMETDSTGKYISERNEAFMDDSGISSPVMTRFLHAHFQPTFGNVETRYDFLCGSKNASVPWQYHTHSRYFVGVAAGKIQLRLAPWKNKKYLGPSTKPRQYSSSCTGTNPNVRFLECTVNAGVVVFIPPYWWYTVTFLTSTTTCFGARYSTLSNKIAHFKWDETWRRLVASLSSAAAGAGKTGKDEHRKKGKYADPMIPVPADPVVPVPVPVPAPAVPAAPFRKTTTKPKVMRPPPSNKNGVGAAVDEHDDVAVALLSPLIISSSS